MTISYKCPDCDGSDFETTQISPDFLRCLTCDDLKLRDSVIAEPVVKIPQPAVGVSPRLDDPSVRFVQGADDVAGRIDAAPSKAVFLRQGDAISFTDALSELIDNSIDAAAKAQINSVEVAITVSDDDRSLSYVDNAGGMSKDGLKRLLTFASEANDGAKIGNFGIGGKAAIGHFVGSFSVTTSPRFQDDGFYVHLPSQWFDGDNKDWTFEYCRAEKVEPGTTRFDFRQCRRPYENQLGEAESSLSERYSRFLRAGTLALTVNKNKLAGSATESYIEAAQYAPIQLSFDTEVGTSRIHIDLQLALMKRRSIEKSGVFYYLADRLFAKDSWDQFDMRVPGRAGMRQEVRNYLRCEITFNGPVSQLPVNAYKNGIGNNLDSIEALTDVWPQAIRPYFSRVVRQLSAEAGLIEFLRDAEPTPIVRKVISGIYYSGITRVPESARARPPSLPQAFRDKQSLLVESSGDGDDTSVAHDLPELSPSGKREEGGANSASLDIGPAQPVPRIQYKRSPFGIVVHVDEDEPQAAAVEQFLKRSGFTRLPGGMNWHSGDLTKAKAAVDSILRRLETLSMPTQAPPPSHDPKISDKLYSTRRLQIVLSGRFNENLDYAILVETALKKFAGEFDLRVDVSSQVASGPSREDQATLSAPEHRGSEPEARTRSRAFKPEDPRQSIYKRIKLPRQNYDEST